MSEIIFNPDEADLSRDNYRSTRGGLLGLFMRLTGIEDELAANKIMLAIAIIFFVASVIILWTYL